MWIRGEGGCTILTLKVIPNAAKDVIEEIRDDKLVVRLRAPAVEGKANTALLKFFSKQVGVAKAQITIIHGEKSRVKVLSLKGLAPEEVAFSLGVTR